jgi:gas vesicle protein
MSTPDQRTPDQIRADIERTRGALGSDVDALADKVSPSQIAHRQTEKAKARLAGIRDTVMGSTDHAASSASDAASDAVDSAKATARNAVGKAKGNPLAVGVIAFGAGWLASSLLPATRAEEHAAGQLKEQAQPLLEDLKEQGQAVGEDLKDAAQQHVEDPKNTVQDAAHTVQDDAQSAAEDVKDSAQGAADDVRNS